MMPSKRPLVGVLGGVGPMATAYFLQRLITLTDAQLDQDHVDVICFSHAGIPDRTAYVMGKSSANPGPVLAADARRLTAFGADFLVMPCNTAHTFTQQVLDVVGPDHFVSIVDESVAAALAIVRPSPACDAGAKKAVDALAAEAGAAGGAGAVGVATGPVPVGSVAAGSPVGSVGLLATQGTVSSQVYHAAFAQHGIEVLAPEPADQQVINTIIYEQVKAGIPADALALCQVAERLVARGAGVVLLACTELSVAAVDHGLQARAPFLDTMDALARATITRAGARLRD